LSTNIKNQMAELRTAGSADSVRTRILDTAGQLFYRKGIRTVSVDAIAKEAGTNKMTLYKYFASKDGLVAEYLRRLTAELDLAWEVIETSYPHDPEARLRAHIEQEVALIMSPSEYTTAFINAYVELMQPDHPAWPVIRAQKVRSIERFVKLFRSAKIKQPEQLADKISLLTEGARISMQCFNADGPSERIASILEKTIADHRRPSRARSAKAKGKPRRSMSINKVLGKRPSKVLFPSALVPTLDTVADGTSLKDRIIVAAGELFQKRGIHAVGVGDIAKAAKTNKMTLYYHFPSKDVLIEAYLRNLAFINAVRWARAESDYPEPWERVQVLLTGVYDAMTTPLTTSGALAHAAIELKEIGHFAHDIAHGNKLMFWSKVLTLFRSAKTFDPEYLTDVTILILEGGRFSALCHGPEGPAGRATALLAAIYEDYANRVK
jgi:AcrR family transcriptional regulator